MSNDFKHADDNGEEDIISRTQIKREAEALQKIGEFLVDMSKNQLALVPLEGELSAAIVIARRLKNREGKRRQLQYIGKIMRAIDITPITDAIDKIKLQSQRQRGLRKEAEVWRDKMIEQGQGVIEELLTTYPNGDRQHLRQLLRTVTKENKDNAKKIETGKTNTVNTQSLKLFNVIRETLEFS